jgi:hypothetical protein
MSRSMKRRGVLFISGCTIVDTFQIFRAMKLHSMYCDNVYKGELFAWLNGLQTWSIQVNMMVVTLYSAHLKIWQKHINSSGYGH